MSRAFAAVAAVFVIGVTAAVAFVAGARYAGAHYQAQSWDVDANAAGQSARFLTAVRAGERRLTTQYFEDRIDGIFANLTYRHPELSPGARAELKLAAEYRRQFPNAKRNPEWDARVAQGMLQVR